MSREHERRQRVHACVAAAKRIHDPTDPLGMEVRRGLPASCGLSPAGVELALREHLEVTPTAADIDKLLASMGEAAHCHVILSANVATAALRALACAVAVAPRVSLKPSRRDPVVAEALVRALAADPTFCGDVGCVPEVTAAAGDEVHVYASNATIAAVRKTLPKGVTLRAHGTGIGVAVIHADADEDVAANALADDLVPFDGGGCLSPRLALVQGGPQRAEAFAERLDEALKQRAHDVPRGPLTSDDKAALAKWRQLCRMLGGWHESGDHAVAVDGHPSVAQLGPPLRAIQLLAVTDAAVFERLLRPLAGFVTTLGHSTQSRSTQSRSTQSRSTQSRSTLEEGTGRSAWHSLALSMCPRARHVALGRMQRPPLDGPVDLR